MNRGISLAALLGALAVIVSTSARAASPHIALPVDVTPVSYDIEVSPNAGTLSFTGVVAIAIDVAKPTRTIELNAADIAFRRVALDGAPAAPAIALDAEQETVTFTFAQPIAPGRHSLAIAYAGKINQQASGLFALDYETPSGKSRALFTQFENSDARRFVPCFDEPGLKATFHLSVVVPKAQTAVSNMPIASTRSLPGERKRVVFATTPKMSSYLLFFGLGDFERVSRMVDGVDVGVIVKRGDKAKAAFALDAASQILPYYDSYFGIKYPLPKLDLIAAPGGSQFFSAMENWGAIFYFERDLLVDPLIATEDDRQNVYITIAHEMAHQWFGDLVTMAWWDDLWLNEGFASWMENKATDHFHPEWKVWLQQLPSKQNAMAADAKDGGHPVITPINDVLQANEAFDEITYAKGASVIRMLEAYTGPDAWRDGVRAYIAHHAYGNAVTDDLWREVDAVSPRKVSDIAHDFTLQSGVPMARVSASGCDSAGGGQITLTPDQFAEPKAPATGHWRVPLVLASGETYTPLVLAETPQAIAGPCSVIVNAGQTGYVRALYDASAFGPIAAAYATLAPDDQLGLLDDLDAESIAGYARMGDYLDLTNRLHEEADPVVWRTLAEQFSDLDHLYDGLPSQAAFRAYALGRFKPQLARLGWVAKPGEAPNTAGERTAILSLMGRIGDPAVAAEARRRLTMLSKGQTLEPAERDAALVVAGINADSQDWDAIRRLAKTAPSEVEKTEYYATLGRARDPVLAQRALDLALSGEPEPTTAPSIIAMVARLHPNLTMDFITAHWDRIEPLLESDSRVDFVADAAGHGQDSAILGALDTFAAAHIPATASRTVRKARAQILYGAEIRADRLPQVDRWLAANGRRPGA